MTKEPKRIYIVIDYWIDYEKKKVYAIVSKDGILYLMEQKLQEKK